MANRTITQLNQTPTANPSDVLPIVNNNITKKIELDDAVGSSTFSTNKINILSDATPNPEDTISNPEQEQFVIQSTAGTIPRKIRLRNIYPITVSTDSIDISFNSADRNLTAFVKPNSLDGSYFGTEVIQTSAIQDGAITEAKIDPSAKIGGATGSGTDRVFYVNDQTVNFSYSIPNGKNAMTAGPVTVQNGVTVTVPDGSVWTVV